MVRQIQVCSPRFRRLAMVPVPAGTGCSGATKYITACQTWSGHWEGHGVAMHHKGRCGTASFCRREDGSTLTFLRCIIVWIPGMDFNLTLLSTVCVKGYPACHWLFQQDNDSKHTTHAMRDWLREHDIMTLAWPANSPDMNCIENAWFELERHVTCHVPWPQTEDQLWASLQSEWYSVSFNVYVKKLYASIPHCIQALLDSKDW